MSVQKRAAEYINKTSQQRPMANENKNIFTGGGRSTHPQNQVRELAGGPIKGPTVK